MGSFTSIVVLWSVVILTAASALAADAPAAGPTIVPKPVKMTIQPGAFTLTANTPISDRTGGDLGRTLAGLLAPATGFPLQANPNPDSRDGIRIELDPSLKDLGSEGYRLTVTPQLVTISAAESAGAFYAIQTIRQLLPVQIFQKTPATGIAWTIPCVQIEDYPRFKWRGLMMDSGRHFFSKDEVLRFLDSMALHKLNTFHWHLTEDQGWRIEIKKYPKLTEIGAWRKGISFGLDPKASTQYDAAGRYGGFYTQDQVREVVAYAAARHITVVPEIEMPGHCQASLAAYPDHSCTGGPFHVAGDAGVMGDVYCAGNDATFDFLQDVLSEVVELFPGSIIHIGGDECPKGRWQKCPKCQARIKALGLKNEHELQSYFVQRIEKFLNSKGKRIIGWDEILEGGLAPNATVMSWRGIAGGITAAKAGHDVVMSPTSNCYLDYYQAKGNEPKAIGGFVPLNKVYSYEPVPAVLSADEARHVLGTQGNLWSEYIPNFSHLEYMAWPRGCAIAEIGWSPKDSKDWADFSQRIPLHLLRLKALGANYRPFEPINEVVLGQWKSGKVSEKFAPLDLDIAKHLTAPGEYGIDFQFTGGKCRLDIQSVEILEDGKPVAADKHVGQTGARNKGNHYVLKLDQFRSGAHYTLRASIRSDGGNDSNGEVVLTHTPSQAK